MLIARVRTNRSDMEYLCRNREEIIDIFDMLRLGNGDKIILDMLNIPDEQLTALPEASHADVATWENYGLLEG